MDYAAAESCRSPLDSADCPFCAGHEDQSPPAVWQAVTPQDQAAGRAWTVRVVPNKFPALQVTGDDDGCEPLEAPDPYEALRGFGGHEVVIETPRHDHRLADFSASHARLIVDAYAARLAFWRDDGRTACAVAFRNEGALAGASLAHAHTQLIALPRVPGPLVHEIGNFSTYADANGGACLLCAAAEADSGAGLVIFDDGITRVVSPWAALSPYFVRIVPRRCAPTFADASDPERDSLAAALVAVARAYRGGAGDPAFNLIARTAPFSVERTRVLPFHWHVDVVPRFTCAAGFEVGTGWGINSTGPQRAAELLRSAIM